MFKTSKSLGLAALFLFASAVLHVAAPVVGGFTTEALLLIPFGLVFGLAALGLLRGMRWLAWLTFLATLAGGIVALGYAMSVTSVPDWWYLAIVAADWLTAAMLLVHLWWPKQDQPAEA